MLIPSQPCGLIYGLSQPPPREKPFVIPAWMPGARLLKLRFRPRDFTFAFLKIGNEVRQYLVKDEYYYLTIDDRFEVGRNQR